MPLTASLAQPYGAIIGQPCQYTLTLNNAGASAINMNTLSVSLTNPNGQVVAPGCYRLSLPAITPQIAQANALGQAGQYNLQVAASGGTQTLSFAIVFDGPIIPGSGPQPTSQFLVQAMGTASDTTTWTSTQVLTAVSQPQFGQAEWIQNFGASAPPPVGSLQYNTPAGTQLLL